mmetsp:Transcript_83015/g.130962  ORF Transcript_83015/g.130962 Transcript_83015/m.130962 type:complete len:192 (-) Transcript_83015:119-694(-)|eukprot:CAMPEP_0169129098 /NCGR_PEP_ID=MMETSP1015-20121227/36940_1 /TAXON_ID=342587 /ORGANISM="Karlodinium micrum, Strain CCMP2283" /LENGTH=191 /DNA_ID=CAMNT_0009193085 /DNA_START=63 /DNA_END=638 /DNA_ORIENTATION=-
MSGKNTIELLPGMCPLEFAMGSHGLEWKNTEVVRVSCQARLLGVKPGWTINKIGEDFMYESWQVWEALNRCKKAGRKYRIIFMKDNASQRADLAKQEAEEAAKKKAADEKRQREEYNKRMDEEAARKSQAAHKEVELQREEKLAAPEPTPPAPTEPEEANESTVEETGEAVDGVDGTGEGEGTGEDPPEDA